MISYPVHYLSLQNTVTKNRQTGMLRCSSYKSMFTTLTQLPNDIYCVNILKIFKFRRICWVKVGNMVLYRINEASPFVYLQMEVLNAFKSY